MGGSNDAVRGLDATRRRLQRWRERHGGRGRRIPEALWGEATEVARLEGVTETARALRLDPGSLARRLESATARAEESEATPGQFVELTASELNGRSAVEVVNPQGERLRIEVLGSVDVEALVRAFRAPPS